MVITKLIFEYNSDEKDILYTFHSYNIRRKLVFFDSWYWWGANTGKRPIFIL